MLAVSTQVYIRVVSPQELLAMVPQPVLAVLMLFPVTDASEKAKAEEDARLKVCALGLGPATAAPTPYACRWMQPLPCQAARHAEEVPVAPL